MASWTEEQKAEVIAKYKAKNPTADNSTEIVNEIAEEMEQSPNGVRMVLVQAKAYVKKEAASAPASKAAGKTGEGAKRVGKEESIAALKAAITDSGGSVDNEILDKLTGKAAVYLREVILAVAENA